MRLVLDRSTLGCVALAILLFCLWLLLAGEARALTVLSGAAVAVAAAVWVRMVDG